ncbi:MAG: methionyl-tRNA formyltransferase [Candidatus Berkelbacteria bacterium]|nr:MAG: methionyl-tRNA formyltransferase [Candidatus Berkelbacteria bacterium]QQG52006.1 MAG: methionyl-tRNA formyltransferase [Candidatus Berkelbacteria bacterium]
MKSPKAGKLELKVIYHPALRRQARPVVDFGPDLKNEAEQMIRVMKEHHGLGLAAPQVDLDKRLIVYGYEPKNKDDKLPAIPFTALMNPKVVKFSQEKETMTEGCLSLPGLELPVTRSAGVTVNAQNLDGQPVVIRAKGLAARVLQHEIDHLDGILFTDRADNFRDLADYRFAKIVFFGSDDFSLPVLRALVAAKLSIIAAITETDKPAGRGGKLLPTPIKTEADKLGIAIIQPESKEEITAVIRQLKPDLVVLASYGKILLPETLSTPTFGALNVHPSLLPKYRGATPIQSAILSGEDKTGVTIMTMAPEVDAGLMIAQETHRIESSDTAATLRHKLAQLGATLLVNAIPPYLAGQAKLAHQMENQVTKTQKLSKEMGQIDWSKPLQQIDREIRAFYPWPGAYTDLAGKRLKFLGSRFEAGRLILETVQLEGKKPAAWSDFERGYLQVLKKTDWYGKIS